HPYLSDHFTLFSSFYRYVLHRDLHSFPTRRSSDLAWSVLPFVELEETDDPAVDFRDENQQPAVPFLEVRQGLGVVIGWRTGPQRDRKSTRLNSSHVAISYAVFCLKKKTHYPDARD